MFRFLIQQIRNCKPTLAISIVFTIITMVLSIGSPYVTGKFIDFLVLGQDLSVFYKYIIVLVVLWLGDIVITYFKSLLDAKLNVIVMYNMNLSAIEYAKKIQYNFFIHTDSAYLNQRLHQDSNVLANYILNGIIGMGFKAISMIVMLSILYTLSQPVAIFVVCLLPLYALIYHMFKNPLYKTKKETMEVQSTFFSKINEQLYKIKTIKLNSWYADLGKALYQNYLKVYRVTLKNLRVSYLFSSTDKVIRFIGNVCLFGFCGVSIMQRNMSVGEFTIINTYFLSVIGIFGSLFAFGKIHQDAKVSYEHMRDLFAEPQEQNGTSLINEINKITVQGLNFSYGNNSSLYNSLDLEFERGKLYTLSGHNGSGKSTLVDLISGIQQEFEGEIYFNSIPISQLNLQEIRRTQIAFVEQEPILFFDTIRENILFGLKPIDNLNEKIDELGYRDLIESFPNGLDTKISEKSANISGGEKQKISIIRALIKNPNILIMDEPNSALDKTSQQHLCELLTRLKQDKIIILISHHNSFLDIADVNYSLDQSKTCI